MAGLLTYSGIITKSKAMESTLLTDDDFERIINLSSVTDIISYLKEHKGYRQIFRDTDIGIHRGEIEHELIHSLRLTYAKLYRFARVKQRKSIQIFFCRFEVQIIKLCLQGVIQRQSTVDLSLFKDFFERHSNIKLDRLMNQDTIEGLVEALKGTDYYMILKDVSNIVDPTLFDYETRLDVYYYEKMWKMKDKFLSKRECKVYTDIMGQNIDLLNLMWIYRFKTYFDTDNGKIMRSIIPIHYKISKKKVADMVATESIQELNDMIASGPYRKLFGEEISSQNIEICYQKYISKVYHAQARKNPMSLIPIEYFLYLKERELDKLTTALECVRYSLPADQSLAILAKL